MKVETVAFPGSASGPPGEGSVNRRLQQPKSALAHTGVPRNMTGIYLGLPGNSRPPRPKTAVPPLARSRATSRIKTQSEEQHYKRVELLRIKEEKRGFSGNPVKRHQQPSPPQYQLLESRTSSSPQSTVTSSISHLYQPGPSTSGSSSYLSLLNQTTPSSDALNDYNHNYSHGPSPTPSPSQGTRVEHYSYSQHSRRWGPGRRIDPHSPDDPLRPNLRNFITVCNRGLTRSEKLGGGVRLPRCPTAYHAQRPPISVSSHDLPALEDCFRKVCKGDVELLHNLLPGRQYPLPHRENTGFVVRSYRNPSQAEILAHFPSAHCTRTRSSSSRPLTVPANRRGLLAQTYLHRQQPPVQTAPAVDTKDLKNLEVCPVRLPKLHHDSGRPKPQ